MPLIGFPSVSAQIRRWFVPRVYHGCLGFATARQPWLANLQAGRAGDEGSIKKEAKTSGMKGGDRAG